MMLINGECREHIEVSDRGFQYGDGLFETIAVINGQAVFWDQHLGRLKAGCQRLNIPFPGEGLFRSEAQKLLQNSNLAVLKLIITRGSGGRGYRQPEVLQPTRIVSLHPFPNYPDSYKEQGINARFCATRLGLNPALAGIKHLNRLEQVLARAEWTDPDIQEGIMLDTDGHVIEGTMSNLLYAKNNVLFTPTLCQAGVAGIIRGMILALAARQGQPVTEQAVTQEALLLADEVFVCNSIIGVWPVKKIASTSFPVGLITKQIQSQLGCLT